MTKVTPHLLVDLIETFPPEERNAARRDLAELVNPPFSDLSCRLQCRGLPVPIGLLEYALRFGNPASVELLLEAGADPNDGMPRLLTQLTIAPFCRDEGRIEKLEALLRAGADSDYVECAERCPPTPLIALARSKLRGIQRYWLARLLRSAGAPPIATNDYELHVMTRLLAELRALDGIMECLPPAERTATRAMPGSLAGLVAAVLRSEDPVALGRMIVAQKELKLQLDFDASSVLAELSTRIAGKPISPGHAGFIRLLLEAGALPNGADESQSRLITPILAELRAIDGIVDCLSPAEQAAFRAGPMSPAELVAAVMRSEDPAALDRLTAAKRELRLPLDFDATSALIGLSARVADNPVSAKQAGFARALLRAGAEMQSPRGGDSAFERALEFENHELVEIFLDAGARPDLASAPEMVFELARRQGLPQRPKARSG